MSVVVNAVKHSLMRTISVVCTLLVIAGIVYSVWRVFNPKPTENYRQSAETITNNETNYYPNKRVFFLGVSLFGLDIGISKLDYDKNRAITP